ncbi:tryptophan 7-halogenase [Alteromonas aestuariivivens]|uniref:Tryptophan 7-halogenase n=1 Tax=Alteromonas aestuariivivens TaxID=1938339 RepID=A0A3D8M7W8_9ALTE|nr:tryptophan halogenase family protein [Alteromonas aestuariivivens]RDV25654.1 tryptophan 7-halogenase [Alteromonas aestuariivivens]
MTQQLRKIIILGGGSAGWMTAAALGKILKNQFCEIQLIESQDIGTVGVGEATIPQILLYNDLIGLDENEFLRRTQGTFKLGIQFTDWDEIGSRYYHAFGEVGKNMEGVQFYHYWMKMRAQGKAAPLDEYTLSSLACNEKRFMRSVDAGNSPLSNIAYAFHFDAGLYALYLRELSEKCGVVRTEGKVTEVQQHPDGSIKSLRLADGSVHEADFFIDCSGFRAVLIEQTLQTGFDDWRHWLPCDRALTVASTLNEEPWPFTRAAAQKAGWQWRIPLQHRIGNGHVYCSEFMDEAEARQILLSNLDGKPLNEPRLIRFVTGKRKKFWNKNCLAIGLSSGFMEPLESTSLHLVQMAISKFFSFFPTRQPVGADIDEFNRQMTFEFERIRDFLILHYHVTQRSDAPFWEYCRTMPVPDSLTQKIEQFKASGRVFRFNNEMFSDLSWFEVMYGQGLRPESFHGLTGLFGEDELARRLDGIRNVVRRSADYMPSHQAFINEYCKAPVG